MALFGDLGDRRELEKKAKAEGRLPPGQSLTLKWPVLHDGRVPEFDPANWDFKISGEVEQPARTGAAFGKIKLPEGLQNPHIDRESFLETIGKKQNAVGDFSSHARAHQFFSSLRCSYPDPAIGANCGVVLNHFSAMVAVHSSTLTA